LGFARHFGPRDLAAMAVVAGVATLAVGIGAELALGAFRPWQADYRFAGTIHPNAQGVLTAVLCLASFCLARSATRGRPWLWACFAVGLLFLILTRSRTSYGSLLAAMAALWLLGASARARTMAVLAAGFVVCAAALAASFSRDDLADRLVSAALLGRAEQAGDLTGRVPLWNELLGYAEARPLQGYGYRAFWGDNHIDAVSADVDWTVREAHNAFLETVLSVGLIGGVVLLALVFVGLARAAAGYRASGDPGLAFILGLLVFCLTNAFLESGVPNFPTFLADTGLVLLMTMGVPR
jgi:O-antigen ligase